MVSLADVKQYLHSQLCVTLPIPTKSFQGQTVIVTGSNTGMGLEAARHLVRLSAEKVILAVRNLTKGNEAKASIESTTGRSGVIEVWELDHASYASVISFAEKAKSLERLDAIVLNAGVYHFEFHQAELDEETITVNVITTMLLAIMLMPKLRETSRKYSKDSVCTFTGSFVHWMTTFPEKKEERIFDALAKREGARMDDRYNVSKLIDLLLVRELATKVTDSNNAGNVIVSIMNPGFVDTTIMRHASFLFSVYVKGLKKVMSRTQEVGGRILVNGAEGGRETHGQYLNDCAVGTPSAFVLSEEGMHTQKKLWHEIAEKLEKIQPGIMQGI